MTQYDAASGGNVVDEVKSSYDSWGLLSTFEQDLNSAVGAGGSVDDYEVSYVSAKAVGGRNTLKRSTMTLPSGNVITYTYRSTAYLHDLDASRVTQLTDGGTALVTYNYNGLDTVVGTTLDEPDVMSLQQGSTSGSYPDLDRFNRVVTSEWTRDAGTAAVFYDVDLAYDRNSNITSAVDNVHAGFDVLYTNDDLNRLVRAEEGTLSGGSISSRTRDQQWTLTQVGNWDFDKVDLNGDGDFIDAEELYDDRTHNAVNELEGRDIDDSGTDDFTLDYDEAGNLIDDGEDYTYEWDAFYRLRKIKNRSTSDLVAEYKYNGLGYRISIHEDTDDDQDVDASDKWFHHAFDEGWRWVATFREDDSDPKEEFLHHAAGLDGRGTGSYIDLVILRDRDINSGWTSAADGTLEERIYYCQNWRADVSALVTDGGQMLEWVKYSAYGVPFGLPGGDTDSDGDCDATDVTQVETWVEQGPYDVRGDIDLDGDVDSTDSSTISSDYSGITLGREALSDDDILNRRGYAGYECDDGIGNKYHIRHRVFDSTLGRWMGRDPTQYVDSMGMHEYARSRPQMMLDPTGSTATPWQQIVGLGVDLALPGHQPHSPVPWTDGWDDPCNADGIPPSPEKCLAHYGVLHLSPKVCFDLPIGPCKICTELTFVPACICMNTPDSPFVNCARACIACSLASGNGPPSSAWHEDCFTDCEDKHGPDDLGVVLSAMIKCMVGARVTIECPFGLSWTKYSWGKQGLPIGAANPWTQLGWLIKSAESSYEPGGLSGPGGPVAPPTGPRTPTTGAPPPPVPPKPPWLPKW